MSNKKDLKWEVKKIKEGGSKGRWGIFLQQKFCKTDEPVCYGASRNRKSAQETVDRMNNPDYWNDDV
jgi:hypothetical protein